MRESPLALHGSAFVPNPLEPSGQSSRGFGGAGGAVGAGTAGVAAAATDALGWTGTDSFFASSSQPQRTAASVSVSRKLRRFSGDDMARILPSRAEFLTHSSQAT